MMPVNVLHVLGTAQAEGASIAGIPAILARRLDPQRFRIHACFLGEEGPLAATLQAAGVRVSAPGWSPPYDLAGALRFWRAIRGHNATILHQHFGGRSVRWLARKASRAPLIMHLHGRVSEQQPDTLVPMHLGDAAAVIVNSAATAGCVRDIQPEVIYPGVPLPEGIADVTRSEPIIIGTAARLVPLKGIAFLIGAIAQIAPEFPELRLEIAGTGPEEQALREHAARSAAGERIRFLGWRDDLATLASRWQVYVQPSLEEALGIGILQAMAAGLPVIASHVGGISEVVVDGATGFLVPPAEPTVLAERLRLLVSRPELRGQLGATGRRRAAEHFSEDGMASRVAAVYEGVLARRVVGTSVQGAGTPR